MFQAIKVLESWVNLLIETNTEEFDPNCVHGAVLWLYAAGGGVPSGEKLREAQQKIKAVYGSQEGPIYLQFQTLRVRIFSLEFFQSSDKAFFLELAEETRKVVQVMKAVIGESKSSEYAGQLVLLVAASSVQGDKEAAARYFSEVETILEAMRSREEKHEYVKLVLQAATTQYHYTDCAVD